VLRQRFDDDNAIDHNCNFFAWTLNVANFATEFTVGQEPNTQESSSAFIFRMRNHERRMQSWTGRSGAAEYDVLAPGLLILARIHGQSWGFDCRERERHKLLFASRPQLSLTLVGLISLFPNNQGGVVLNLLRDIVECSH
jgi:hypothetical protein